MYFNYTAKQSGVSLCDGGPLRRHSVAKDFDDGQFVGSNPGHRFI